MGVGEEGALKAQVQGPGLGASEVRKMNGTSGLLTGVVGAGWDVEERHSLGAVGQREVLWDGGEVTAGGRASGPSG